MRHARLRRLMPKALERYILSFEAAIEDAVWAAGRGLPAGAKVLDAGAGECRFSRAFSRQRYVAVDLAIGDATWDYDRLNAVADLAALPFRGSEFDACLNIVTLEHVSDPARVVAELGRILKPGGLLLLAAPQEWEVHQAPHDFYRYTRHGLRHLLAGAGFCEIEIRPAGGYFRVLSRRLLDGLRFFRGIWFLPALVLLAPPALLAPLLDGLDRDCDFTLGYICTAKRPG